MENTSIQICRWKIEKSKIPERKLEKENYIIRERN